MVRPLQTLSNLLAALREEDFSFRARTDRTEDDALTLAMREVNALADTLREQRLGALEATALLRKVMEEIDVAVFAFDAGRAPAPRQPRGRAPARRGPPERLLGLGADGARAGRGPGAPTPRAVLDLTLRPGAGPLGGARTAPFRQGGLPSACSCSPT